MKYKIQNTLSRPGRTTLILLLLTVFVLPLHAADHTLPWLRGVGIDEQRGAQLPLDSTFHDENGRTVELGQYFGTKPVVLSFAYYSCPMLCPTMLNGLTRGLRAVPARMGRDYEAVNISIDPKDDSRLSARKKAEFEKKYGGWSPAFGWHFLTGDEASIRRVTDSAGFHYKYDPTSKQYAHIAAILIATPKGKISRYLYGLVFEPRDLRLALLEASSGQIGSPVDRLLLFCYHYDALTGKYSLLVTRVFQLAGCVTVLLIGVLIGLLQWRVHRRELR